MISIGINKLSMKKSVWLLLGVLGFLASCEERKVETAYDSLSGEWYLYAVYLDGGNSDMLPSVKLVYPCIESSTATFGVDSTFQMYSDCEGGTTHGTYVIKGDSVFATDTANVQQILLFKDSALYQKRTILGAFSAELRFQKTIK